MKTMKKLALIMGAGMLIVSLTAGTLSAQEKPKGKPWPAPESAVKMKNPSKDDGTGKDVWGQQCKSCHGAKGQGDGAKA